jgi:hypothetical protein
LVVDRVEGLDRREALLGIALSAAAAPALFAPAAALATTGTAGSMISALSRAAVCVCVFLAF